MKTLLFDHQSRMRWYNPTLEDYEWRDVPRSDNEALQLLEGSPHTATCIDTYQEWLANAENGRSAGNRANRVILIPMRFSAKFITL